MAYKSPFIWGNVYDDNGKPIEGSLVRLMRQKETLSPQAPTLKQTKTDSNGYYELELPNHPKGKYCILIGTSECPESVYQKRKNNICYY